MIGEVKELMDAAMLLAGIIAVVGLYMPKRLLRPVFRRGAMPKHLPRPAFRYGVRRERP